MITAVEEFQERAFVANQGANPSIQLLLQLCSADGGVDFVESNPVHSFLLDMGFAKKR